MGGQDHVQQLVYPQVDLPSVILPSFREAISSRSLSPMVPGISRLLPALMPAVWLLQPPSR